MRQYVAPGIAVAAVIAAVIVVVGNSSPNEKAMPMQASQVQLPAVRPGVGGGESGVATGMADTSADLKKRITRLEQTHRADPKNMQTTMELANAYFLAGRYSQAGGMYTKALALRPGDPTATVRRAMVWHAQGDEARAIVALNDVLKAHPKNQEAHYTLAIVYFALENISLAREEWQAAADIDPRSRLGQESQNFVELIDNTGSSVSGQ